jgi:predicted MarR family transcription regulator
MDEDDTDQAILRQGLLYKLNEEFLFDLGKPESLSSPSTHYARAYYQTIDEIPLALEKLEPDFSQVVYECLTSAIYERFGLTPLDMWQLDRVQYQILMKHVQEYNRVLTDKQNEMSKSIENEKSQIIIPHGYSSKREL